MHRPTPHAGRLVLLALACAALALRLPGVLQEPWIDEIWSWGIARGRASAWEALAHPSSNSHPLNTLWIWLLGERAAFWPYRLPALLSGVLAVPLAARIAARSGRASAIAAAALVAVAYLPTVYASEARGYALLVLASLALHESARTWIASGSRVPLALFWASAIAGLLAQYLFVLGFAAIALGAAVELLRADRDRAPRRLGALLGPPLAFFALWWWLVVRHVFNAGAPPWDVAEVLRQTLAWATGLPEAGWTLGVGALIVLLVLAADVRALRARGDAAWVVQALIVLVLPAAGAWALRHEYVAPRYFLVPIAFWLLSLARVLGALADRGRAGLAAALALFVLFAAGNLARTAQFLRVGRGAIAALVAEMGRRSDAQVIRVAGNEDFNVPAHLEWFARALAPRRVEYVPGRKMPPGGTEFLVVDAPRFEREPEPQLRVGPLTYALVAVSRRDGPCGSEWALYARR